MTVSVARKLAHSRKKKKDIDRFNKGKSSLKVARLDKATIARNLQLQEQNKELLYSSISLLMKLGLLAIVAGSFVRLGIASHRRITRQLEISSALRKESKKLEELNSRFDRLFTIGGENRLINSQDHLIAPNSVRVIWR